MESDLLSKIYPRKSALQQCAEDNFEIIRISHGLYTDGIFLELQSRYCFEINKATSRYLYLNQLTNEEKNIIFRDKNIIQNIFRLYSNIVFFYREKIERRSSESEFNYTRADEWLKYLVSMYKNFYDDLPTEVKLCYLSIESFSHLLQTKKLQYANYTKIDFDKVWDEEISNLEQKQKEYFEINSTSEENTIVNNMMDRINEEEETSKEAKEIKDNPEFF